MHVIAVMSEKGGVGKTTVTLDLSVAAAAQGLFSAVLDTDPQGTASKWMDVRGSESPIVLSTHAVRLGPTIEQAKKQGINFVVIDTPPYSSMEAAEAAKRADLVLVPIEPHLFSLETAVKTANLLKIAGAYPAVYLINKAPVQGSEADAAVEHITGLGLIVCPVVLHLRAAHRHATNEGKVAAEYQSSSKAAEEMSKLFDYCMTYLTSTRKNKKGII
jgi:chromosome partitioning protein